MKIYAIFYTDDKYKSREKPLLELLKNIGFDDVYNYNREWLITTDFYLENKEILDMSRGGGYWLWKPYIIIETMKKIENNNVVFYLDAGDNIKKDILNEIKSYMIINDYIITNLNDNRGLNKFATKRDCFILMNCDEEKYYNVRQIEAGILVFKKTEFNINFLNEWLFFCKNKNIITDFPNIFGENFNGFSDHRHDQSILCNLTVKYNMKYSNVLLPHIDYNVYIPN